MANKCLYFQSMIVYYTKYYKNYKNIQSLLEGRYFMQRNNNLEEPSSPTQPSTPKNSPTNSTSTGDSPLKQFIFNHHKHPETGGMGHASLEGVTASGRRQSLSVYPGLIANGLAPAPHALASFYTLPSQANDHPINNQEPSHSPIHTSYDITSLVKSPENAQQTMQQLKQSIHDGNTAFSIAPSFFTRGLWSVQHALFSPRSRLSNSYLRMKIADSSIKQPEHELRVTNCADSVHTVLQAGGVDTRGLKKLAGYNTPGHLNTFFSEQAAAGRVVKIYDVNNSTIATTDKNRKNST
jgi:hypothetical protein